MVRTGSHVDLNLAFTHDVRHVEQRDGNESCRGSCFSKRSAQYGRRTDPCSYIYSYRYPAATSRCSVPGRSRRR